MAVRSVRSLYPCIPETLVSNPAPDAVSVLLVGASGLVGQGVLQACLASDRVARIVSLVRTEGTTPWRDATPAGRVEEYVLPDFGDAARHAAAFGGLQACFYCAGAPPVGTAQAEYHRVTVELTLAVARAYADANPQGRFLYVSGANADARSRVMPLRVKGEAEQALAALPLQSVMLRPGGVRPVSGTGTRHGLLKPLYAFGGPAMKLAGRLAPQWVTDNRAIGQAMIALACEPRPPAVVECAGIATWAQR